MFFDMEALVCEDSFIMFNCLINSMSFHAKVKALIESAYYYEMYIGYIFNLLHI